MSNKPAFLAFAADNADLATLKQFASAHGWPEDCVQSGDIRTATAFLKSNASPVLLLAEVPSAAEAPALLDGLAEVCDPTTKVIITGTVNEYSFYCWLTEIGIFSYLLRPLTAQMLENTLLKSTEQPAAHGKPGRTPGKVIAVLGARGGVGATTIGINLAGLIAELSTKNIALVDIDPHEGSVALALDLEPSRGFREALEKPDRIDSLFIARVMSKPHKRLSILSSEESLHDHVHTHDEAADALLRELRDAFDVIVLDIPRHLNPFARKCIAQADQTVLVSELALLSLRDTLRLSDLMRDVLRVKLPIIVANRVGMGKHAMPVADFEKGVSAKVAYQVPFAPDLYMQVGSEIPAIKNKGHAAVKPLIGLVSQLVPDLKVKPEAAAKKGFFGGKKKA